MCRCFSFESLTIKGGTHSAVNFFENELKKIVHPRYPDATYVGRACYVCLGDKTRAKIQFITSSTADHYDALRLTVLNRQEGTVDNLTLRFGDLFKAQGHNKFSPHIWDDHGDAAWYIYQPSSQDYQCMSDAVTDYLEVFQEPEMHAAIQQFM